MRQRANEVVETMKTKGNNICCIQETRWRGGSARVLIGTRYTYKFFWSGNDTVYGGVGVLIKKKLIEQVLSVEKVYN